MSATKRSASRPKLGWLPIGGRLYVNVDDLIALLRRGDYGELADDFEEVAADERAALYG